MSADEVARPARLFGTDGIRGVAGELLSAQLALAVSEAATLVLADRARARQGRPQVLVIRDTRESGEMLEAAVAAGVSAAGADALLGSILPTPAAPLLIARHGLDLGVVLSASHNPFHDNGIKLFGPDGYKLSDDIEHEVEAHVRERAAIAQGAARSGNGRSAAPGSSGMAAIGSVRALHGAEEDYLRELQGRFRDLDLAGRDVLLDCANGATYRVAPEIMRRLGARVSTLADTPDGRNINAECGSTHVEPLMDAVRAGPHELGFAFDGDGDRVLAVDARGELVDGDELMALAALHMQRTGRLAGGGVVVTVMTNYGFHEAMRSAGIEVATTAVGDRYVLEEMRTRGFMLGGEQSGHIIDFGFQGSGDGIAAALLVLEALGGEQLVAGGTVHKLPQRLVNVSVRDRGALEAAHAVHEAIRSEQETLAGRGRVLVRPSGTEPLVRVMVEAPTAEEASEICSRLAALLERELA